MGLGEFPSCWWLMSEVDVICESHSACIGDREGRSFKEGGVKRVVAAEGTESVSHKEKRVVDT